MLAVIDGIIAHLNKRWSSQYGLRKDEVGAQMGMIGLSILPPTDKREDKGQKNHIAQTRTG